MQVNYQIQRLTTMNDAFSPLDSIFCLVIYLFICICQFLVRNRKEYIEGPFIWEEKYLNNRVPGISFPIPPGQIRASQSTGEKLRQGVSSISCYDCHWENSLPFPVSLCVYS